MAYIQQFLHERVYLYDALPLLFMHVPVKLHRLEPQMKVSNVKIIVC